MTRSLLRALGFLATAAALSVVLNLAVFFALGLTENAYSPTECSEEEVECGPVMEFAYEDSWPLVPLVVTATAIVIAWALVLRRPR